jgi:hypothetical protein
MGGKIGHRSEDAKSQRPEEALKADVTTATSLLLCHLRSFLIFSFIMH